MAITQVIATLDPVYNDSKTFYEDIAERNNTLVVTTLPTINTWTTQANTLADEVNDKAAQVASQAVDGGYSQEYIDEKKIENIASIKDFGTLHLRVNTVFAKDYHPDIEGGGGTFVYDSTRLKSEHNGGTIIDPTAIFPDDWTNQTQLTTWFDSANAGSGVWVRKYDGAVNVKWFGTKGDNTNNDTLSIQKAINYTVSIRGGKVYLPTGIYKIEDSIVMNTGIYGNGIGLYGDGRDTLISQVGLNKDAIIFSTTQFLQNSFIKDMSIISSTTSGNVINIKYGCTVCNFENLDLTALNTSKSCFIGDYTSFGGGIFDTKFTGSTYYQNVGATVAGFNIKANGTIFNENVFENLRVYNSGTVQFFSIRTVVTSAIWLVNNSFKNINFEVCNGGGIIIDSIKNCLFENLSFWDTPIYNNHLLHFTNGTSIESTSNTIINYTRNGDVLNTGINDIYLEYGNYTTIINAYVNPADNPRFNFNGKIGVCIGSNASILNGPNFTYINDTINTPVSYTTDAYIDSLKYGGRSLPLNATTDYSGGYLVSSTLPSSSGHIWKGKTSGNVERSLVWTTMQLYALGDNVASLGEASNKWSTVYAVTGTINTSDDRLKTYLEIEEKEKEVAKELKLLMKKYKFNDAIEEKGLEKARIHFGTSAQSIVEVFKKYELDANDYALLCYDEWEEKDEVLGEDGAIIIPKQEAGNRYGIRYEELICFIISAL